MDKAEKIEFVRDLCAGIGDRVIAAIIDGRIPQEWDGHELRQLVADKFAFEVSRPMREPRSKRVREYRNTVIVNNL